MTEEKPESPAAAIERICPNCRSYGRWCSGLDHSNICDGWKSIKKTTSLKTGPLSIKDPQKGVIYD